jgi:hypothetical protein
MTTPAATGGLVDFSVIGGTNYQIAVDGFGGLGQHAPDPRFAST